MNWDWDTVAALATAIGVAVAAWQLRENGKLAQSAFEDSLDQQYRALAKDIPVDALIGRAVRDDQKEETRELIYNYLDLSNEQTALRMKNKITKDTWIDWSAGIETNLQKVAFMDVWEEIRVQSPSCFTFLERLTKQGFAIDPVTWD